jgi:FKBP-type peptidyl-prolyl cis-trans isomerase 2
MKKTIILSLIMLSSLAIFTWCKTQTVSQWDLITVSYDSFLQDGKLIEEWKEIQFTVWIWETFPIFDKETEWMKLSESKNFIASAEEWYWVYHNINKVQNITATVFNTIWQEPTVWEMIELWDMKGLVLEVSPITIKIDFNWLETREPVEFRIKILEIQEIK